MVQQDFNDVFSLPHPLQNNNRTSTADKIDVIIVPTAPTTPPLLSAWKDSSVVGSYTSDVLTVPASLAGLPALSVPIRVQSAKAKDADDRATVGIQVIGQYGDERVVWEVGRELEEWSPPV